MDLLKIGVVLQKPDKQFSQRLLVVRVGGFQKHTDIHNFYVIKIVVFLCVRKRIQKSSQLSTQ